MLVFRVQIVQFWGIWDIRDVRFPSTTMCWANKPHNRWIIHADRRYIRKKKSQLRCHKQNHQRFYYRLHLLAPITTVNTLRSVQSVFLLQSQNERLQRLDETVESPVEHFWSVSVTLLSCNWRSLLVFSNLFGSLIRSLVNWKIKKLKWKNIFFFLIGRFH